VSLPDALPKEAAEIIRKCLQPEPFMRGKLEKLLKSRYGMDLAFFGDLR
jgi:hypothetical protein